MVILGHGAAQPIFDQHMPLWEAHCRPILVNSPADDPLRTSHMQVRIGESAHNGPKIYWRIRELFAYLESHTIGVSQFLFMEYDSFLLNPRISPVKGIQAVLCDNTEARFQEHRYCIPPIQMDYESLCRLNAEAIKEEEPCCFGFLDRIITHWAALAKIRLDAWQPTGIAIASIDVEHLKYVRDAIFSGVSAVHGVKTREVLDLVLQWRKEYIEKRSK